MSKVKKIFAKRPVRKTFLYSAYDPIIKCDVEHHDETIACSHAFGIGHKASKTQNQTPRHTFRNAILLLLHIFVIAGISTHASAANWPSEVVARYDISFAGFKVGTFNFRSNVDATHYSLTGEANISAVFGTFKWNGTTRSSGFADVKQPIPSAYAFDYRSNSKSGSTRIEFKKGYITKNDVVPYRPYTSQHVPLLSGHMRNVYDPISAVMALTRSHGDNPCNRKIPVFDGKQRFDLVLTLEGQKQIKSAHTSGGSELAYICKVQYVPLGGYKANDHTCLLYTSPSPRDA